MERVYVPLSLIVALAEFLSSTLRDTVLPLSVPMKDARGNDITKVPISEGTLLSIGIFAFNRRKDLWGEDAAEWRPERWLGSLAANSRDNASGGVFYNL